MMTNTLNYMKDHMPDVAWLIILLGIWAPNDEIFAPNYRYVKEKDVIEAEYDNADGFWTELAPLTEK